MTTTPVPKDSPAAAVIAAPTPIVALDFATARDALSMVERLRDADYFKVGLQLFTAAGPELVRALRDRGCRIFLDLKFHDIPNTVAGAVRSAAELHVDMLTVHASGGEAMLRAAVHAASEADYRPRIFAVSVLTSFDADALAVAWGRSEIDTAAEAARLATMAANAGVDGVVAAVHDVHAIREQTAADFPVLTPGIRLDGDPAGDQARIASPADAVRLRVDYMVVGRSVTAAADPNAAYARVLAGVRGDPDPARP